VTTTGTRQPGEHPPGGAGARAGGPAPTPAPSPSPTPRPPREAETAVIGPPALHPPGEQAAGEKLPVARYADPPTVVMPALRPGAAPAGVPDGAGPPPTSGSPRPVRLLSCG